MGAIKTTILTILLTLLPLRSLASEDVSIRVGQGVNGTKESALYSFGYDRAFARNFEYSFDFGFWTATQIDRKSSPFVSLLVGPTFGAADSFNGNLLGGVSVIGYTDGALSYPLEFTEELSAGYDWITVGYKHLSDFGFVQPDFGRDYLFVNFKFWLSY